MDTKSMTNIHHIQDIVTHQRLSIHGVYTGGNAVDDSNEREGAEWRQESLFLFR